MHALSRLGWNDSFQRHFDALNDRSAHPARVAIEHRDRYSLVGIPGTPSATLAGRLRHASTDRLALPAVGDWVAVRPGAADEGVITALLPRRTAFVRRAAGAVTEPQVVAANVDTVLVVTGLDGDFNPRRVERYLAAITRSGAEAVIVLNKADLCDDPRAPVSALGPSAATAAVRVVSALDGSGVDTLREYLEPGRTLAVVGSSGAGKSTLVNRLLGRELLATGAVRVHDDRGQHTTSHRELVPLEGGAVLIDTPGMRELQLWADGDESDLAGVFDDIAALAGACRFRDCGHADEPGCAVRGAIDRGALSEGRLASYRKLQRELAYERRKQDPAARYQSREEFKRRARVLRSGNRDE